MLRAVVLAALAVAAVPATVSSRQTPSDPWPPVDVVLQTAPGLKPPTIVERVQARYTRDAMRRGIQGVVTIQCVVELDGSVGPLRVTRSLDASGLDDEAAAAVRKWRFTPGSRDGTPVRTLVTVHIGFAIKDAPPPTSWPEALTAAPGALDVSTWRQETLETTPVAIRVRYPSTWTARRGGDRQPALSFESADKLEFASIFPPRATRLELPLTVPRLVNLGDGMKALWAAQQLESLGVGQAEITGRWWVWQETQMPTAFLDRLVVATGAPELAAYVGIRTWFFDTVVDGHGVTVTCTRLLGSGLTRETAAAELHDSGRRFDAFLRQLTFQVR